MTHVEHFPESSYLLFQKDRPRSLVIGPRHCAEEIRRNPVAAAIDDGN